MFAGRYFGQRYYAKRYFPRGVTSPGGPGDMVAYISGTGAFVGDLSAIADLNALLLGEGQLLSGISAYVNLESFIAGLGEISSAGLVDGNAPPPTELPTVVKHIVFGRMGAR